MAGMQAQVDIIVVRAHEGGHVGIFTKDSPGDRYESLVVNLHENDAEALGLALIAASQAARISRNNPA